jgi:HPt (histidine-containing phosphotransfer) domain-containing protein
MTMQGNARVLARLGISEEIYNELFADFLVMVREKTGLLQTAVSAGDCIAASKLAHTIKGSAANLGVDDIADIARIIENESAKGVVTDEVTNGTKNLAERVQAFGS